jgi:serpin B
MIRFSAVCLLLVAALRIAVTAAGEEPKAPDLTPVVEGNNAFAFDLYAKLRAEKGNLFFSPYSISAALAMTYAGASGKTADEIAEVLHFTLPQEQLHPAFASLAAKLRGDTKKEGCQFRIANRLWGQTGYTFLPKFLQITRDDYGAELAQLNFRRMEEARQTINTWVEDQTEKKIKDLIGEGILNRATRLVLTDAIYFMGNWDNPFESDKTHDASFHITADKQITAPMMHQSSLFPYGMVDGTQILELPYVGKHLSMVVLLPKELDGLANLEKQVSAETLRTWTSGLREQEVKVYLPKFKVVSDFRLDAVLQSMGMPLAFSPHGDLSGMDGKHDLYLRAVVHKTLIDVNEVGTEAAAGTGGEVGALFEPPIFHADHPFLFLIRDNRIGTILFLGRVMNPKE